MSHLSVRKFRNGDESAIVELFNSVYGEYCGFVPRTVKYWRWCCLERPDVEKDGVLLAFHGERFCGYLVVGSSGNIWEFCVIDGEAEAAKILLGEAVGYLEKAGASSVSVNVPRGVTIINTLHEAGFSEFPGLQMFVTALDPCALIRGLAAPLKDALVQKFDDVFGVRLRDVPPGASKEFSVKILNRSLEVAEGFPTAPSVIVKLNFIDFLSILFRGSSIVRLFLTGRIKVKPLWKVSTVLALLSSVRLRNSWFFPLSDCI